MTALPPQNVKLIILTSVFLALAIVMVGLRLITRRIKHTGLALNDYLIIWALIMLCGESGIVINAKSIVPVGVHDASIKEDLIIREHKTYMASDILWVSIMACIKLSILDLYNGIFSANKQFCRLCYLTITVNILWWISTFIAELTICQPLSYTWNKSISGHCGDVLAGWISAAIINVVLDAVVIVLPMPVLWKLPISTSKKILISGVFSLGIVVIVISCLRVQALFKLDLNDLQYNSFYTDLWSVLEPCLAVVSACLPVLPPLYTKLANEILSSLRHALSQQSYGKKPKSAQSTSTRRKETQRSDQIHDIVYPVSGRNVTKISCSKMEFDSIKETGHGVMVYYAVDVASARASSSTNPSVDNGTIGNVAEPNALRGVHPALRGELIPLGLNV